MLLQTTQAGTRAPTSGHASAVCHGGQRGRQYTATAPARQLMLDQHVRRASWPAAGRLRTPYRSNGAGRRGWGGSLWTPPAARLKAACCRRLCAGVTCVRGAQPWRAAPRRVDPPDAGSVGQADTCRAVTGAFDVGRGTAATRIRRRHRHCRRFPARAGLPLEGATYRRGLGPPTRARPRHPVARPGGVVRYLPRPSRAVGSVVAEGESRGRRNGICRAAKVQLCRRPFSIDGCSPW